jgi:hypothetical protein
MAFPFIAFFYILLVTFFIIFYMVVRKRPLGRPRRAWEDNIKMDVHEVGGGRGDWSWLRIGAGGGHL